MECDLPKYSVRGLSRQDYNLLNYIKCGSCIFVFSSQEYAFKKSFKKFSICVYNILNFLGLKTYPLQNIWNWIYIIFFSVRNLGISSCSLNTKFRRIYINIIIMDNTDIDVNIWLRSNENKLACLLLSLLMHIDLYWRLVFCPFIWHSELPPVFKISYNDPFDLCKLSSNAFLPHLDLFTWCIFHIWHL